jgi:hypothetical protein
MTMRAQTLADVAAQLFAGYIIDEFQDGDLSSAGSLEIVPRGSQRPAGGSRGCRHRAGWRPWAANTSRNMQTSNSASEGGAQVADSRCPE